MGKHKSNLFLITGIACFIGGAVLMIKGMMWGLFVLLLGFAGIVFYGAMMMRVGGYDPMNVLFNGWGKGRQQSETEKLDYQPDTPDANVWDQMEQKK